MEFLLDILDDRLDAIEAAGDDDRERLRLYFEMWRAGLVDPLRDPGVVVIATLDPPGTVAPGADGAGPRPRWVVANDGGPFPSTTSRAGHEIAEARGICGTAGGASRERRPLAPRQAAGAAASRCSTRTPKA